MASIAAGRASETLSGSGKCFRGSWVAKAIGRASEAAGSTSGAAGRTFKRDQVPLRTPQVLLIPSQAPLRVS